MKVFHIYRLMWESNLQEQEGIEKDIREIRNEMLRAFLSLYWERGYYKRRVLRREIRETLSLYDFNLDKALVMDLERALVLVQKIRKYNLTHR